MNDCEYRNWRHVTLSITNGRSTFSCGCLMPGLFIRKKLVQYVTFVIAQT